MTVIRGTWACAAGGGMTLKCPTLKGFLLNLENVKSGNWKEWDCQAFSFIPLTKEKCASVSKGLRSIPVEKTVISLLEFMWTFGKQHPKLPFQSRCSELLDRCLFPVHDFINRDGKFDFIVPLFHCVCMLSWDILVYTKVIYRVCVILAWFRS